MNIRDLFGWKKDQESDPSHPPKEQPSADEEPVAEDDGLQTEIVESVLESAEKTAEALELKVGKAFQVPLSEAITDQDKNLSVDIRTDLRKRASEYGLFVVDIDTKSKLIELYRV